MTRPASIIALLEHMAETLDIPDDDPVWWRLELIIRDELGDWAADRDAGRVAAFRAGAREWMRGAAMSEIVHAPRPQEPTDWPVLSMALEAERHHKVE